MPALPEDESDLTICDPCQKARAFAAYLFSSERFCKSLRFYSRDEEHISQEHSPRNCLFHANPHRMREMGFVITGQGFEGVESLNYLHSLNCTFCNGGCRSCTFCCSLGETIQEGGAKNNDQSHGRNDSCKEDSSETGIENEPDNEGYNKVTDRLEKDSNLLSSSRLDGLGIYCQAAGNLWIVSTASNEGDDLRLDTESHSRSGQVQELY